jgi:hypothetical protein
MFFENDISITDFLGPILQPNDFIEPKGSKKRTKY